MQDVCPPDIHAESSALHAVPTLGVVVPQTEVYRYDFPLACMPYRQLENTVEYGEQNEFSTIIPDP